MTDDPARSRTEQAERDADGTRRFVRRLFAGPEPTSTPPDPTDPDRDMRTFVRELLRRAD